MSFRFPKTIWGFSRRGFVSAAGAMLYSAASVFWRPLRFWAGVVQADSGDRNSLSQGALDLREIFKDEVRANFKDNVYTALGNKLHLDGEEYIRVARALATADFLEIIRSTPMPERDRQRLLAEQTGKAEAAFVSAVDSLNWPKYSVHLESQQIRVTGPEHPALHAGKSQPLLFILRNMNPSPMSVHVACPDLQVSWSEATVQAHSSRYFLASITPPEHGERELRVRFATDRCSREFQSVAKVVETAVLEGILLTEQTEAEPVIARVRITDLEGTYFPLESEPSGIIRMPVAPNDSRAERWVYAEGRFRARVPLGTVRVSIRRGLEYRSLDEHVDISSEGSHRREFVLRRWTQMEKEGFYSGDMHCHMLDPRTALFESRAEGLALVNVMVFKHLESTYTREHFTGALDPASDARHFIYYNEEYRNEPLGHIGLVNLKKIVEPIATGRLGLHWPTIMRFDNLNMPLPFHGDTSSPDYPLLLEAMRETHRQGGMVDWAHLRSSQWEFPLDAEEGQLDVADIMTHTEIPEDLALWYALLNCGFRIPACAGTDRIEPTEPVGHQRTYVYPDAPLSYESWMKGLKTGCSFVTNGPMLHLDVRSTKPGGVISLSEPQTVSIASQARSQLPFEKLEVIVNGEVVHTADARENGRSSAIAFAFPVEKSCWVASRCMGKWNKELFYTHPVFAHTNPVYLSVREERIQRSESARYLLGVLEKLEQWAAKDAHFETLQQKEEVRRKIRSGMEYFKKISRRS